MKQPKLKIGQKYLVIEDYFGDYNGKTVTVSRLDEEGGFYNENDDYFCFSVDKLQLLPPKKKVNKFKYSREEWLEYYTEMERLNIPKRAKTDLLAKQPKKNKPIPDDGMCGMKSNSNPSLINDIETIEELKKVTKECIYVGETYRTYNDLEFGDKINSLIKNQRILTEIIKSLMEKK